MRLAYGLFIAHVVALVFGLGGLLIALPHPELWAGNPAGVQVFDFGMRYAGALHILFGAAAMLVFGGATIGWRKTLVFFALSTTLSVGMELLGTGTGWPFGAYSYTSGLGYKLGGRVPYTIPLSWFYMGFSAVLLASSIATTYRLRPHAGWAVGGGVWLLTVWDLVLDPAMAHESLPVKFWIWHETGPYFGMPVQNFVGWSLTGLLFMALSRLVWRADLDGHQLPVGLPLGVYIANMLFAMVLSLSVGLWLPVAAAVVFGIVPSLLALTGRPGWVSLVLARGTR